VQQQRAATTTDDHRRLRHHRRHLFLIVGRRRTALAMMHGVSLSSRSVASYRRKVANAVDESEHSELE
jgi:hypothetical protein